MGSRKGGTKDGTDESKDRGFDEAQNCVSDVLHSEVLDEDVPTEE